MHSYMSLLIFFFFADFKMSFSWGRIVSTFAGSTQGYENGNANDSLFMYPYGITISHDGTLYVADTGNHRIRKISTNGIVSTVAGSTKGFKDGNANNSLFDFPCGITISYDETLYVADRNNHRIRKISTNGIVSTVAGSTDGFKDGNTNNSLFSYPCGITISHDGTLYVTEEFNYRIRKISKGIVSTVTGSTHGFKDGNTNDSSFFNSLGIAISHDGTLYVVDRSNHRIRKISTSGIVSTVAGSTRGYKNGNVNDSLFNCPRGITISHDGTLYVADRNNHRIRKISTSGIVSTVAGSTQGFKDGNANESLFNYPQGIAISHDGTLYVADYYNHRIRKISSNIQFFPMKILLNDNNYSDMVL